MGEISEKELKQLHDLTLKMAETFVDFCNKNQLLCYFCGGGCIGAVRHKGWIPWDDDLDFFMPREDYEKAIHIWKKTMQGGRYVLEISDENHIDGNLFFTIRDSLTTYIKPYQKNMDITHGIVLDVLPLDGYPNSAFQRKKQCFWALIYSLYCAQIVPEHHGRLVRTIGKVLLAAVPDKKKRYKIWKYAERKMTKYKICDCDSITELCSGPGYMKNRYPKRAFEKAVYLQFEDTKMPVPAGYNEYLKIAFGNYKELPPVEQRVPSHDAYFMDLNKSYKEYRGKKYKVEKVKK